MIYSLVTRATTSTHQLLLHYLFEFPLASLAGLVRGLRNPHLWGGLAPQTLSPSQLPKRPEYGVTGDVSRKRHFVPWKEMVWIMEVMRQEKKRSINTWLSCHVRKCKKNLLIGPGSFNYTKNHAKNPYQASLPQHDKVWGLSVLT